MNKIAKLKQNFDGFIITKFMELRTDKKGADMIEWVGIIALAIGVIMIISPTVRSSISELFNNVFSNLKSMSIGK